MNQSRRSFFRKLAGLAATAAVGPSVLDDLFEDELLVNRTYVFMSGTPEALVELDLTYTMSGRWSSRTPPSMFSANTGDLWHLGEHKVYVRRTDEGVPYL